MVYDYYKILDITRTANIDDIKKAYRNKAKIFHPDVNHSPKANEIFIVINEAYEILSDDRKRYLYDLKLNYVDITKIELERKKRYAKKYSRPEATEQPNYTKDRNNSKNTYKFKTEQDYYNQSPLIYNMFFVSGMLAGFLILIVCVTGTIREYWPAPFGLISLAGIALIRDGWKGFLGKKTIASSIVKMFRK
jgi:curved DNA-binding protein CbpA